MPYLDKISSNGVVLKHRMQPIGLFIAYKILQSFLTAVHPPLGKARLLILVIQEIIIIFPTRLRVRQSVHINFKGIFT
jgi:hypothetical protein